MTGKTYADVAKEGIEKNWEVYFKGSEYDFNKTVSGKVEVDIIDRVPNRQYLNNSDQKYMQINIDTSVPTADQVKKGKTSDDRYVSHAHEVEWNKTSATKIELFSGDGRHLITGHNYEYTQKELEGVIGHEMGHALGLDDAYAEANGNKKLSKNAEVDLKFLKNFGIS